jgi:pimeloyl-ACP methyl ester carboxylesterase
MSRRVRLLEDRSIATEVAAITSPCLIVTGASTLDRIVPPRLTLEYARLLPHASVAGLKRSGHLGIVTEPQALTAVVAPFVETHAMRDARHQRVG